MYYVKSLPKDLFLCCLVISNCHSFFANKTAQTNPTKNYNVEIKKNLCPNPYQYTKAYVRTDNHLSHEEKAAIQIDLTVAHQAIKECWKSSFLKKKLLALRLLQAAEAIVQQMCAYGLIGRAKR